MLSYCGPYCLGDKSCVCCDTGYNIFVEIFFHLLMPLLAVQFQSNLKCIDHWQVEIDSNIWFLTKQKIYVGTFNQVCSVSESLFTLSKVLYYSCHLLPTFTCSLQLYNEVKCFDSTPFFNIYREIYKSKLFVTNKILYEHDIIWKV